MVQPALRPIPVPQEVRRLHQILGLTSQDGLAATLKDAVLICIDCEAFEFDQSKVTEVGIAILDTKDIRDVGAGEDGQAWIGQIKYAHIRPTQYLKYVNRKYVKGCEDKFNFGTTQKIDLKDIGRVLKRVFAAPENLSKAIDPDSEHQPSARNIIFVAHGLSNDDAYLSRLGFSLKNADNLVHKIDSQTIAGGSKKNSIGLKRLLLGLDLPHKNLHNAGNDAAYTLQALVLMVVKEHSDASFLLRMRDDWNSASAAKKTAASTTKVSRDAAQAKIPAAFRAQTSLPHLGSYETKRSASTFETASSDEPMRKKRKK